MFVGNSKYGKLALLKFNILGLFKILLTIPESVWTVLISKAEEIGMSAALKKDVRSLSPLQDRNNTRKNEIKYFNY